eukprot:scaffold5565_cov177-Alexandrium_tamarense.AAC.3
MQRKSIPMKMKGDWGMLSDNYVPSCLRIGWISCGQQMSRGTNDNIVKIQFNCGISICMHEQ